MNLGPTEHETQSGAEVIRKRNPGALLAAFAAMVGMCLPAKASAEDTPIAADQSADSSARPSIELPVKADLKMVREAAKRKQPLVLGSGMNGLFLREAFTRSTYTATDTTFSATAAAQSLVYANYMDLGQALVRSDRSQLSEHLGGGSTGFDGQLLVESAVGVRWPLAGAHGPLLRLGARGWLQGNDDFYSSLIELPTLHAGYHLFKRGLLMQVAARGGVALIGRFRTADASARKLGESFVWGGHATVHVERALLSAEWSRIEVQSGPVTVARVQLCGSAHWLLLCGNLERHAERADPPPGSGPVLERRAVVAGLSLGVGQSIEPRIAVAH